MSASDDTPRFSLRRWSQRKAEARVVTAQRHEPPAEVQPAPDLHRATTNVTAAARDADARTHDQEPTPPVPELPPIESLTPQSDFSAFMQPEVDDALRRQALRKLFSDPHFNVMDRLDVYIDDYSTPDPISPETVRTLVAAQRIFAPVPTRVNERGFVEDLPREEIPVTGDAVGEAAAASGAEPVKAEVARGSDDIAVRMEPASDAKLSLVLPAVPEASAATGKDGTGSA